MVLDTCPGSKPQVSPEQASRRGPQRMVRGSSKSFQAAETRERGLATHSTEPDLSPPSRQPAVAAECTVSQVPPASVLHCLLEKKRVSLLPQPRGWQELCPKGFWGSSENHP